MYSSVAASFVINIIIQIGSHQRRLVTIVRKGKWYTKQEYNGFLVRLLLAKQRRTKVRPEYGYLIHCYIIIDANQESILHNHHPITQGKYFPRS
jgi:hypothetical protein